MEHTGKWVWTDLLCCQDELRQSSELIPVVVRLGRPSDQVGPPVKRGGEMLHVWDLQHVQ